MLLMYNCAADNAINYFILLVKSFQFNSFDENCGKMYRVRIKPSTLKMFHCINFLSIFRYDKK